MSSAKTFEQEGFAPTTPITKLMEQLPLPLREDSPKKRVARFIALEHLPLPLEEDSTTISSMWEPEPVDFIPPPYEADEGI